MIKKITALYCILFAYQIFAQVGIKTNNPQETLHLGASNSTIRIDGLNSVNNSENDGTSDKRVYVNASGDLIIKNDYPAPLINFIGNSLFPTPITISSNSGNFTSSQLATGSFTLTNDYWVNFNCEIKVNRIRTTSNGTINDGRVKLVGIQLEVDGTIILTNTQFFISSTNSGTVNDGTLTLKGDIFKHLASGSHSYRILGFIEGGGSFRANFGGNTLDRFQIVSFN